LDVDGFSGACAFSTDESKVALADGNGTVVRILELPSGRLSASPLVHSNNVVSIAWDPKMRWLITGTRVERAPLLPRGQARIWDARTGQPLTDWLDQDYPVQAPPVFSPDGERVALFGFFPTGITSGQFPGSIQVLELPSGKPKFLPLAHSEMVFGAAFSPDGRYLATAVPREVRVWNAHTGEPALPALTHGSIYYSIEFSPDGAWLVAGGREEVRIWDVRSGRALKFFSGPIHCKSWPHFTPDGRRLVTTTAPGRVQVWDLATLEPALPEFDSGEGEPSIWAAFSPDGRSVAVVGANGKLRQWNAESGSPIGKLMSPVVQQGQSVFFTSTEFRSSWSTDGKWLAVPTHGRGVRVWDLANGMERLTPLQHSGALFAEFSSDSSRLLTGGTDNTARIWNVSTGVPLETPLQHSNVVYAARFSPDGQRVATASLDSTAQLWETATGAPLGSPIRFGDRVGTVNFSPDGTRLVIGGAMKSATLHDARSGQQVTSPLRHALSVMVARFSPDGRQVLTGSEDRTARIWDAATGQPLIPPLVHEAEVVSGEFSGDGLRVVTGSSDATARVWDALTGEPLSPWLKHAKPVLRASFSPDARRVVTVTVDGAQVWDVASSDESAEVLAATARLSAGAEIGVGQQVERLASERLDAAWALASSQPQPTAAASPEVAARWHRRRAALSLRAQDWFASGFHARRLVQLQPEDAEARASLARVIERRPPPRDPATPPEMIDLSNFYNASLAVSWHVSDPGNDLSELPRGMQTFAGTRFDVRGLVQVVGDLAQPQIDKWRYPSRVTGIGVHRKLIRLQFLHAVKGRQYPTGTSAGYYRVHFANGRREEIPILYNQDATDWWEHAELPQELPGAAVAWRGANASSRQDGKNIRLFKLTWNNPSPDMEIVQVDFTAEQGDPFLVALTAE
jgi:WD40 repeat protein